LIALKFAKAAEVKRTEMQEGKKERTTSEAIPTFYGGKR